MRVAVAQIDVELGAPGRNFENVRRWASRAREAGAELAVFPEMVDTGYRMDVVLANACTWEDAGGFHGRLRRLAGKLEMAIVCGLSERDAGGVHNAITVIDSNGDPVARYRKSHLFPLADEQTALTPGEEIVAVDHGDLRFGLAVCYDLRFPDLFRQQMRAGASAYLVPSAWPFPRLEQWKALTASRAIENQAYLVAANRAGADGPLVFCGSSRIVDPFGTVLASADEVSECLITADLDPARVEEVRTAIPALSSERPELYARPIRMVGWPGEARRGIGE